MSEGTGIFATISDVVKRFGQSDYGLPAQKQIAQTEKLIGFSMFDTEYVIPLDEINEVLEVPKCTKLPRVKSWVLGVANVRGRLLPIIDIEALKQLQEESPELMLLDIEMPRMDGFEVATRVRASDSLKEIPIIMITSRTGDKHRERAMEIGVNQYMGKPYQEEQLLEAIDRLLVGQGQ
jgi:CheY-like chemotaxis protein